MATTPDRFAYYSRLGAAQKKVYRHSDAITAVALQDPSLLHPGVALLRAALDGGKRSAVQRECAGLVDGLCRDLGLPGVTVQVLAARPRSDYGELHGLYTYDPPRQPLIQLWMRTAAHRRVVAFRSFLRTLLHEFGHHIDFHLYQLSDSFHTKGFYARESSLFRQVAPDEKPAIPKRGAVSATAAPPQTTLRRGTSKRALKNDPAPGESPHKKTPRKTGTHRSQQLALPFLS